MWVKVEPQLILVFEILADFVPQCTVSNCLHNISKMPPNLSSLN